MRGEPQLQGRTGFVVASPVSGPGGKTLWRKAWKVNTLVQTGPDIWRPDGRSILHKTPVTVVRQFLKHASHGYYSGRLEVALPDGSKKMIELGSFSLLPYWDCPLEPVPPEWQTGLWSSSPGQFVAVLRGGARAVERVQGELITLKEREHLLCTSSVHRPPLIAGRTASEGMIVECAILDRRDRRTLYVEVRPADLKIVY